MIPGNTTPDIFREQHFWFHRSDFDVHPCESTYCFLPLFRRTAQHGPAGSSLAPELWATVCSCTSELHCLWVHSHGVEHVLPAQPPHKHTSHLPLSTNERKSVLFLPFLPWNAHSSSAFLRTPKTLLKLFNIVHDFCDFVFCPVSFLLIMMIKNKKQKTKIMKAKKKKWVGCWWKLKAIRCCCTVVVTPSSFWFHPPSGQCSGNEVQRVSQVILHSSGVYVCVYMCIYPYASPLEYTIPFKNAPHVWLCRPLLSLLFVPPHLWILILTIMCWLIQLKTRCQEHTKLRLIFLMSNAF